MPVGLDFQGIVGFVAAGTQVASDGRSERVAGFGGFGGRLSGDAGRCYAAVLIGPSLVKEGFADIEACVYDGQYGA